MARTVFSLSFIYRVVRKHLPEALKPPIGIVVQKGSRERVVDIIQRLTSRSCKTNSVATKKDRKRPRRSIQSHVYFKM